MIVGSWPGYVATQNNFLRIFLDGIADEGCEVRSIDSVDQIAEHQDLDVVLLHWPQRVFWEADGRLATLRNMYRLIHGLRQLRSTTLVVWVAHNLRPHDAQGMMKLLWPLFAKGLNRMIDAVLTLSSETLGPVQNAYPELANLPSACLRHPKYPGQSLSAEAVSYTHLTLPTKA